MDSVIHHPRAYESEWELRMQRLRPVIERAMDCASQPRRPMCSAVSASIALTACK